MLLGQQQNYLLWNKAMNCTLSKLQKFIESDFRDDVEYAPFHIMDIFDNIDNMGCYTSFLVKYVVDHHSPVKSKLFSSQSVLYMNSVLRKAQYQRNMARNKLKKYGKSYQEKGRRMRNLVVKIGKNCMCKYFQKISLSGKQFRHLFRQEILKGKSDSPFRKELYH